MVSILADSIWSVGGTVAILAGVATIPALIWWNRQCRTKGSWLNRRRCTRDGHEYQLFGLPVEGGGHMTIEGTCRRCDAASPAFTRMMEENKAKQSLPALLRGQADGPFDGVCIAALAAATEAISNLSRHFPGVNRVTASKLDMEWNRLFVAAVCGLVGSNIIGEAARLGEDRRKAVWDEVKAALDGWDSNAYGHVSHFVHYLNLVGEKGHASDEWPTYTGLWLWRQLCPGNGGASELRELADDVRCSVATGELIFACCEMELEQMPGNGTPQNGRTQQALSPQARWNPN
jgi:hypothetical protein